MNKIYTYKGVDVYRFNTNRGIAYGYEMNNGNQLKVVFKESEVKGLIDEELNHIKRNKMLVKQTKNEEQARKKQELLDNDNKKRISLANAIKKVNNMNLLTLPHNITREVFYRKNERNVKISIQRLKGKLFKIKDGSHKPKELYYSALNEFLVRKLLTYPAGRWS